MGTQELQKRPQEREETSAGARCDPGTAGRLGSSNDAITCSTRTETRGDAGEAGEAWDAYSRTRSGGDDA
jgi:hypothetical protein